MAGHKALSKRLDVLGDFMSMKMFAAIGFAAMSVFAGLSTPAAAEDKLFMLTISNALASPDAEGKLDGSVHFYFGDAKHPAVAQDFGQFITNKKTNGVGKSDETSCTRAFVSTMIELQDRAHQLGANAVINIHSYYKKKDVSNQTQAECYTGFLMTGVALKGDFVKVPGK